MGKSRLIAELTAIAASEGAVVLAGRGLDIADAPPYWPVISAIRHGIRAMRDRQSADLLASRLRRLEDLSTQTAEPGSRVQTLEVLYRMIVDLAELGTVVLVVEDLHWTDRSTRDLIVYLVANLSTEPVLVIGTYRSDAPTGRPGLTATLAELRRHRQVSCREIGPLSRAPMSALVAAWAPDRPGLEPMVWQRSGGNAFIAEETVHAVLGGDALGLPNTLRDLVLSRVALLSDAARRVARAAAASTGALPHRLLAKILEDSESDLLDAVRETVTGGVMVVDDEDGYRLRHGLMNEVIAADLLPGERIDLHRRYATALSGDPGADPSLASPALSARLAHHWQRAGEHERALVATVAAARGSERMRGYAEAYRHWLRAAELATQVPATSAEPPRWCCLEHAAEAADLAGDHDDAVALVERRLGAADGPTGLDAAMLTARMGRYLAAAGHGGSAARAFSRAAALLPDTGADRQWAEVLAGHAAVLLDGADFPAARSTADRALRLARAAGTPTVEARVLAILGFALAYLEDTSAGSAALAEALTVAERTGEAAAIGEAHLRRAELLSGPLNDLEQGVECARRGVQRVRSLGLARTVGVELLALAANGLFRLGRWEEAEQAVAEAWALAPTGARNLDVRLARGRLDVGRGRFASAEDDLEAVELLAGSTVGPRYRLPLHILRAGLEMWRGRPYVGLRHVGQGLDLVEGGADDIWLVAPLLWHGTRAWAETTRLGLPSPSEPQLRRLRGHCARLVRRGEGMVPAVRDVVATFSATCAAEIDRAEGRSDPAAWARVADLWELRAQPYPTAYARLRRAEALLASRARSASATRELVLAERAARKLGAAPMLGEIADLARRARVRLAAPEAPPMPSQPVPKPRAAADSALDTLTARELEVLTEIASGLTNRQIAGRLFISEKTVGVHVSRIFAKIGVHSRVQASAVLHRSRSTRHGAGLD